MKQINNMREARLQHKLKKQTNRVTGGAFKKASTGEPKAQKKYFKNYLNRGTVIGAFVGTALAISVPSIASEGFAPGNSNSQAHGGLGSSTVSQPGTGSTNVLTTGGSSATDGSEAAQENKAKVSDVQGTTDSTVSSDVKDCAESENGLVQAAADALNIRTTILSKVVDVNQIFQPQKKGGCFAELGDIPDLSTTIPTWSGMQDKILGALKDYANKKVCDAVYEASSQIVGPINDSMKELQNYSQSYDFAKEFAGVTGDRLGIDSNIFMPDKTEVTYNFGGSYQVDNSTGHGGTVTGGGFSVTTTPSGSTTGSTTGSSTSTTGGSTPVDNSKQSEDPYSQGSTLDTRSNVAKAASSFFSSN